MQSKTHEIVKQFRLEGDISDITSYGSGHINDTYKVDIKEKNRPDYLLQRVNHYVFKDVPGLMENLDRILSHINKKLKINPLNEQEYKTLTLIPTIDNKPFFKDKAGNFWRVFYFIEDAHSYDIIETSEIAYQGGKAFGQFQRLISDLPGKPLNDTIPNFHNIEFRLNNFKKSLQEDKANRASEVAKEISFVEERAEEMKLLLKLNEKGLIPIRNCHNDTKLNNVLFNNKNHAICVIDLDTAMRGFIHYDFGDSIRTVTNTANEDEKELDKINFNIELFEAYSEGFIKETADILTPDEVKSLAFSGKLLTFIMGLRFLTDYIDGDIYYKTNHSQHNIQRTRAQFQLLRKMEENYHLKKDIVERIYLQQKSK